MRESLDEMETALKREIGELRWRSYLTDTAWAVGSILLLTVIVFLLKAYPSIPDSFMVYIIAILGLASLRGFYPALLASFLAFFSFDFFFVSPLYSLAASKLVDILALVIFLVTAIITSRLASALRLHADLALRREQEARILYDFARATNAVEDVAQALAIFAQEIEHVFASSGVRACIVILPDVNGNPALFTSAVQSERTLLFSSEERAAIEQVMRDACIVDLRGGLRGKEGNVVDVSGDTQTKSIENFKRMIPLRTEQKVIGVVCLAIDATEQKRVGAQFIGPIKGQPTEQSVFFSAFIEQAVALIERGRLRQENMRIKILQETDALRSALLSSVSHDLRTPLSTIKASATSLLEEEMDWDEEARYSFVSAIERETNRLNRLVENLLDMSRIEAGALQVEKVWYPLEELIHDVLGRMEERLRGRLVETHIATDLPPVELDYVQIDQVISNLIDNALYYTPAGSPIEVNASVQAGYVCVDVADRGPGIDSREHEYIFDKFYRVLANAHKYGHTPGSGLGLAICRGIIEAHGGRIWFEPRVDGGSVFRFTLPLRRIEAIVYDE